MRVWNYLFALLFFCGVAGAEMTIFVSPTGNDKNTGTKEFPLKTIPKALDGNHVPPGQRFSSTVNLVIYLAGRMKGVN